MPKDSDIRRLDLLGALLAITVLIYCFVGLSMVQIKADDVSEWLPTNSEVRDRYDVFKEKFSSDDFIVMTWDGCEIGDSKLRALTKNIRDLESDLILSVTNGEEVFNQLVNDLNVSKRSAYNRLKGMFLGAEDPKKTCAIVVLTQLGTNDRTATMQLVWGAVEKTVDLEREEIAVGGNPYIGTQISQELKYSNQRYLLPTMLLATTISFLCLRNFSLVIVVFITSCGAAAVSVATIPICGVKTGGLLTIIPALVFVLATSGSVHLMRYSLDNIGDPIKLLAVGWKPCVVSALTTSVGMLSLARSNFPAIQNFGLFCAMGVTTTLLFQLVIVPWLLTRFGTTGLTRMAERSEKRSVWNWLAEKIQAAHLFIGIAFLGLMIYLSFGLQKLGANVEVENMFRPWSELRVQLAELERQMGPLDQSELLVQFENVTADDFSKRAKIIRKIQVELLKHPDIKTIYSLINFLPPEPRSTSLTSIVKRDAYRAVLRNKREQMASSNLLNIDANDQTETWRISMRFPFSERLDFRKVESEVVAASENVLAEKLNDGSKASLIYTGKTHLFNHGQHSLLSDLFKNFLLAFVIITPMLIIALRSVGLGLLAMIPNVFPAIVIFGALGWLGLEVDLAIAMTACVALGIAVDDTTHFMVRFREFGGRSGNCHLPVQQAINQCGPAMLGTTLIGGAGMIAYAFSEMTLISNFAIFIVLMLIVALVADVFMLPALLYMFCLDDGANEIKGNPDS